MYICPVCGKKSKTENAICSSCRFDRSRNYEVYATISPLKGKNNHAISKKKQNYESKLRPGAFACSKCKSIRFHIFPETNKILCVDCGAEIRQEELPWKQLEHKANDPVSNPVSEASAARVDEKPEKAAPAQQLSSPTISTSTSQSALTISPFALQKFPFVSIRGRYAAAIQENGKITYTGNITVGDLKASLRWYDIKALASTRDYTIVLKSDGTVAADGNNEYGECDVFSWRNVAAITAGPAETYYILALRNDGTVIATKNTICSNEIQQWKNIVSVAVGTEHAVGLKSDGSVVASCNNKFSQCNVAEWKNIKSIACGRYHTVGLTGKGTVVSTDKNYLVDISKWTDIIAISCGFFHTAGLRADGTVVAAGKNENDQCNTSSWSDIIDISCTRDITVGLKKDGTIITTGDKNDIKGYENLSSWHDIIAIECRINHLIGLKADGTVCVSGYKDLSGVRIPDIYKRQ